MSFKTQSAKTQISGQTMRELLKSTEQTDQETTVDVVSTSGSLLEAPEAENFYLELSNNNQQSLVDELRDRQEKIVRIWVKTGFELGREYALAQQAFKQANMPGRFDDWVKATGYSPRTARSLISIYNASQQLTGDDQSLFEELPRELQRRISSQLTKPEEKRDPIESSAIRKVFSGDVKSLPEFKDALNKEKQRLEDSAKAEAVKKYESELQNAKDMAAELKDALQDARFNAAENDVARDELAEKLAVAEAQIAALKANPPIKEPEDYARLKTEHDAAMAELTQLRSSRDGLESERQASIKKIRELQDRIEATERGDGNYETLRFELDDAQQRFAQKQQEIENLEYAEKFIKGVNQLLDTQLGPLLVNVPEFNDPVVNHSVKQLVKRLTNFVEMITDKLPEYLEGEYRE
ncbi:hypothetical protein K1728_06620 [Weissella confusa]|uniref:hypothetical protein n=1 Tax=Weissella confusa TaxID=1583 RepID=UPI001C6FB1AC|nr:hypothetical protein [Weissella confusa]QYU56865.1 hypothetical protein K1728_06620 [Weissella confusa]